MKFIHNKIKIQHFLCISFFLYSNLFINCNYTDRKISPKAIKGVLDLRFLAPLKDQTRSTTNSLNTNSMEGWNYEKDGAIKLNGEWEFYWEEFISPDETSRSRDNITLPSDEKTKYITLPSQWTKYGYPTYGFASYRLRVLLSDTNNISATGLSIAMTDALTAYQMYINGKLVSENGKIGKSKEESIPYLKHKTFPIPEALPLKVDKKNFAQYRELEIVVHVSNYHDFRSGLWDTIKVGTSKEIESIAKENLLLDVALVSSLLVMGFYHLGLFFNRRKDISPLYFGIFCLIVVIRTVSINNRIILDMFPFLPFIIVHKLQYLSFYLGSLIFSQFFQSLFPEEFNKTWGNFFKIILIPCSLIVIISPIQIYVSLIKIVYATVIILIFYFFKVLIYASKHRRLGARFFIVGLFLFSIAIINDILKSLGILHTPYLGSFGLLTFIIFQATILSRRFASSFEMSEKLSGELKQKSDRLEETANELSELTINLEKKVKERTLDLLEAKEKAEDARKQADIEKGIALIAQREAETERQKSEKLLLNILPIDVANELKEKGFAEPVQFESVSVLFTDFKGFTSIAEKLSPHELVKDLDACFVQFDKTTERFGLEKLKTIGDSYMCAGGIPRRNKTHPIDCVLAALEIQSLINMMKEMKTALGLPYWELRLGIHSGPLVAGVIGEKKFAYDVWGDTVNTASRMESSGTPGKINISGVTYKLVKDFFECEYRGRINAKNKGEVDMYYVNRLKTEFSMHANNRTPNDKFWKMYNEL